MKITIPVEPISQLRPRATSRGGHARVYDPPKVREYKESVKSYLQKFPLKKFENTELDVKLKFYLPIQKSISKKERELRLSHKKRPDKKPDIDNLQKSILDSLNGIVWDDDAKITHIEAWKFYSEDPRTEIEIEERNNWNG